MWSFTSFKLLGKYKLSLIEEDNKFKPFSYQVRNNMETTLQLNDYKFHKPEK